MECTQLLFPAHAGVIPRIEAQINENKPFPRQRGGDPADHIKEAGAACFSPPMRG